MRPSVTRPVSREIPLLLGPLEAARVAGGHKTQLRRVMRVQPPEDAATVRVGSYHPTVVDRTGEEGPGAETFGAYSSDGEWALRSPFGGPGAVLWCREAWAVGKCADGLSPSQLHPGTWLRDNGGLWFPADNALPRHPISPRGRLRWSAHMPRWASRSQLVVETIEARRLQDLTDQDAVAEGCSPGDPCEQGFIDPGTGRLADAWTQPAVSALDSFINGWECSHEVRPGDHGGIGWDDNPWVWVVEFVVRKQKG